MNFLSDDMLRNPYPLYDSMRSLSPVLHDPQSDTWMIFDYEGVKRAVNDHDAFSSSMSVAGRGNPQWVIFFDPPRHTKLRALIIPACTQRLVGIREATI